MKKNNKTINGRKRDKNGGRRGRVRGVKGGNRSDGIINSKKILKTKTQAQPHKLDGVYIIRSNKESLATINLCPGETIYGEDLITIENKPDIEIQNNIIENEKDSSSDSSDIQVIKSQLNTQNFQNRIEYRIWDTFSSKLGAAIESGINNIYMKPGSKVLYLGAGNDLYSNISHISDLVGKEGVVYGVEISEIKGLVLKNMAKERKNIEPIIYDANKPFHYKNSIPNLVDCIFANFSEKDITSIISINAGYFLKDKGGFVCIIKANYQDSTNTSLNAKFDKQIKLLREYNLYVKEFLPLMNFESNYGVVSGLYKPYRDYISD